MNKGSSTKAYKAFTTIDYAIPTKTEVESIFQVLCGAKPLSAAISILPESSILKEYEPEHDMESWKPCSHWCDWWMRPNHLSKITSHTLFIPTQICFHCRDAICMLLLYDITDLAGHETTKEKVYSH